MLSRKSKTARYTTLVPTSIIHANHRPEGLIRIFKTVKVGEIQFRLDGDRIAVQKAFDGVMISFVVKFSFNNADDLTIVE